jgi:hypothetical protein
MACKRMIVGPPGFKESLVITLALRQCKHLDDGGRLCRRDKALLRVAVAVLLARGCSLTPGGTGRSNWSQVLSGVTIQVYDPTGAPAVRNVNERLGTVIIPSRELLLGRSAGRLHEDLNS